MNSGCLRVVFVGIAFLAIDYFLADILDISANISLYLAMLASIALLLSPYIINFLKEQSETDKAKRQENAKILLEKAKTTIASCEADKKSASQVIPKSEIQTIDLQKEAWHLLDEISLEIQILENTLKELKVKGSK